jgi:tryptophanyl-tRNA synthetase
VDSNYWQIFAKQAEVTHQGKVSQFSLETESVLRDTPYADIWDSMLKLNVWALQQHEPFCNAIQDGVQFTVLVGMRPNTVFHLGHLTMMHELHWLTKCGGIPIFIYAGYEAGKKADTFDPDRELSEFKKYYHRFVRGTLPPETIAISDQEHTPLKQLETQISEVLTVKKIMQLYGWDESTPIARLRIPSFTAAAFLLPAVLRPKERCVVLSDINQVSHFEVAKIAGRLLRLQTPSVSYRHLLQSLQGPHQRMSVKKAESLLLLDDTQATADKKLKRCFSGGRATAAEQRAIGGCPEICSFFRVASVVLPKDTTSTMYASCKNGSVLCGECKKNYTSGIVDYFNQEPKI